MGKKKETNPGINRFDPITDEPYPSKDDYHSLFSQITDELDKIESRQKKKKMSYSVSPSSQVLIRKLAESYGATQGGIIDLAPFFFSTVIRKSLKRREERVSTLRTLSGQVENSLKGMALNAPHLAPYTDVIVNLVQSLVEMEAEAVRNKRFDGIEPDRFPTSLSPDNKNTAPAFLKEIVDFMGTDNELEGLLKKLFTDEDE